MLVLILTVVGTGLLYVLVAKIINDKNAKIWLSGYNTMSKEAQEKFDLKGYLIFSKSFFYNLGVYGTLLYFVLFLITDDQFAIQVWIAAQLLPIPYFIYKGNKYKNKK
tara:strand:+ start:218 stop:541 length:324 start_codon:yes stop_codon:yes gene_type:complete